MKFNLPKEPLMTIDDLPFKKISKGKVRENFDLGDELLIIASDRISAFDVIMPNGIPGKGVLLTQISLWWFEQAAKIMPTHLVENHDARVREYNSLVTTFPGSKIGGMRYRPRMSLESGRRGRAEQELPWARF